MSMSANTSQITQNDIVAVEMCSQGYFKYMNKYNKYFFVYIKQTNISVMLTFTDENINHNKCNNMNNVLSNCYKTIFYLDESFPLDSHIKKYTSLNEVCQDLMLVFKNKAFDVKLINQTQVV